ncbi:MAG: hypothetical protein HZB29_12580 [Nitrospinae bacterium]|nr:hypothetical protein [Nitrospinota bacterium]
MGFLSLAARHAGTLAKIISASVTVEKLTASWLSSLGAEAVILDHDGVLGAARTTAPDLAGERLIGELVKHFGKGKVFVLSNTRSARAARSREYARLYPDIIYITAARKPDPEGLYIASRLSGVPLEKIAMIDDGPLTGLLMALEAGAIPVYAIRENLAETASQLAIRLGVTLPQIALVRLLALFAAR